MLFHSKTHQDFFGEFDNVILKSTWKCYIHRLAQVIHDEKRIFDEKTKLKTYTT